MEFLFFTYSTLFLHYLSICASINTKLLQVQPSRLTTTMQQFIDRIIEKNCNEKEGFLFVSVNRIESEYSDYISKKLHEKSTVTSKNFYLDKGTESIEVKPNQFKFAVADPEGDLSYAAEVFSSVKASRARILLILTKKPAAILVEYILSSYWKIQCLNVIVAYEHRGKMKIITYNPYISSSNRVQHLSNSTDLFPDKTRNLHGTKIKCLLTYRDRTKVKKVEKSGRIYYEGKDFLAVQTLLSHINANLEIVRMDNIILNPFYESLIIGDRKKNQKKFLEERGVTLLIKSEQFSIDDEVVDNLYPHAQNDLCCLAPKSSEISIETSFLMIYTPVMWVINALMLFVVFVTLALIRKLYGNVDISKLLFEICRIVIVNNVYPVTKNYVERIFVVSLIGTAFVLNVFAQSQFTTLLTIKRYHPEISTIEELFSSGLPLYAFQKQIEDIEKKYAGTEYETYAKSFIPLTSNEGLMDQMIYRADVSQMPVFLIEHDIAVFISRSKSYRSKGVQVYHLVKECIMPNYQSYKVIHNSPLLSVLNKILRRLEEGGFIDLWAKKTIFNATIQGFLYPENCGEMYTKPISLDMTVIWLYLLFMGYFLGTLAFIGEILTYRRRKINLLINFCTK